MHDINSQFTGFLWFVRNFAIEDSPASTDFNEILGKFYGAERFVLSIYGIVLVEFLLRSGCSPRLHRDQSLHQQLHRG
jgi:hypothetical protein